jgi:non-ribosomal peptide synthetase component F
LGKALSDELRILAKQERTLLAAIVLSAYVVSMSRWCRSDDLLIGFVSHGRHGRPELENMVGCLARTIYLRIPVVPSETLRDLLQKTHHELLLALQHEDFVPPLPPEKATGLLFSWGGLAAHFGRRSASAQQDAVPRLRLQPFPTHSRWPHKLLTFFSDTPSGVVVTASYRPDLLRKESIMRFGNNVQRVAQVLTRELDVRIGSLDLDDD